MGGGLLKCEDTMRAFSARITLVATWLAASAGVALADGPPQLNVGPSCEAAARGAVAVGRDKAACMGDEDTALDTLKQNWSKYTVGDKTQCIGTVTTGGPASYVELLSCLEVMRDARAIKDVDPLTSGKDDDPLTSGSATTGAIVSEPSSHRKHRRWAR
jgi:hypothetical protein